MSGSDNHNRNGRDVAWRQVGTGMACGWECPSCHTRQTTNLGSRIWRKGLKLRQCAKCVAKAAAKEQERLAA